MKKIFYKCYGILFLIFRIFPVKEKKVVFFLIHNSHFKDNMKRIYEELKKRDASFQFVVVSKKELLGTRGAGVKRLFYKIKGGLYFLFSLNYHLATANYIFLNDNFMPLCYMRLSKKTRLVQLWHGVGAFKRFGLSTETDPDIRECVRKGNEKISCLCVTSKQAVDVFHEALGVPVSKIYPTGIPITDCFFCEEWLSQAVENVYRAYPGIQGKQILLYTPTFRENPEKNQDLLEHFDYRQLLSKLGEEYVLLLRFHPQLTQCIQIEETQQCRNVTEYEDVKELFAAADVLINDYSSTIVEYALLGKPSVLYAYDLASYDRGFYYDYRDMAPGPVVSDMDSLIEVIRGGKFEEERRRHFLELQYDVLDGKATERVVDTVLGLGDRVE